MKPRNKGFTLLEVLVALTILSIILGSVYGTFFLAHRAVEGADETLLKLQETRTSLDIMRREIESARFDKDTQYTAFIVEDRDVFAKQASRLKFTTYSPSGFGLLYVYYYVKEKDGKLNLYKDVQPAYKDRTKDIDVEPTEISEDIKAFSVEAKGDDGRWVKTWDTGIAGKLPVEVKLQIDISMKERPVALSETVIPMYGRKAGEYTR